MNAKYFILTSLLSLASWVLFAQQIDRQVISSTGDFDDKGGFHSASTVGEAATYSLSGGSLELTQGFQQPDGSYPLGIEVVGNEIALHVYPNPTSDIIFLDFLSGEAEAIELTFFDMAGNLTLTEKLRSTAPYQVDVSALSAGNYLVLINNEFSELIAEFKIVKTF